MKDGFKKVLITNLEGATSTELVKIQRASQKNGVQTLVNYRFEVDASLVEKLEQIKQKKAEGFVLEHVSIF